MRGNAVSYDGGSFRLIIPTIQYTNNSVKFVPQVEVTNDFNKTHTATISWNSKSISTKVKSKKKYFKAKKYAVNEYSVKVTATIGGKKSTCTITAGNQKPESPKISITRNSDYWLVVDVTGKATAARPVTDVILQKKVDVLNQDEWSDVTTWTGNRINSYDLSYNDQNVERGKRYKYRVRTHNADGYGEWTVTDWIYTLPPDVSDVVHARISNSTNRISWTQNANEITKELIASWAIERSESGGQWITIGEKLPEKTGGIYTDKTITYDDSTCEPDNYYRYRVKPKNAAGITELNYPSNEGTEATYNTPAAPVSIKATKTALGSIKLEIDNRSKTATKLYIEKYTGSWNSLAEVDETEELCTAYTDTSSSDYDEIKYRARSYREDESLSTEDKYSKYTESSVVETLSTPEKPTVIYPVNNAPFTFDKGTVRLEWIHNSTDGTAQRDAIVRIYRNGVLFTTESTGANNYLDLDITQFSSKDTITWAVRTKGELYTYSEYSDLYDFNVYALPEIHITAPENGATISNLPLTIGYTYSDASGVMDSLKLDIISHGEVVYSEDLNPGAGTSGDYTYELVGYLFENDESYTLRLTALSDLGIQTVDEIGVQISYMPVIFSDQYYIDAEVDEETGNATIIITRGTTVEDKDFDGEIIEATVDRAYLYRVYDGERVLIKEVTEGEQITDKYAPLNTEYNYELVEIAETGEIAIDTEICEIESKYWYVYYGDRTARALWDPSSDISLSRPEKQQVRYSGRKYPVSYDSEAVDEAYDFSFTITDREELNAFRYLMKSGGHGVWKSCDGFVYPADFEFSFSADYSHITPSWNCKLSVTRTDGEV